MIQLKNVNKIKNRIINTESEITRIALIKDVVFLVSYPRSGNTWVRFLIGSLLTEEPVDWLNINKIIPWIYDSSHSKVINMKSPKIIKSHSVFDNRYKKVIYLVRDVRDVVVSYYYWHIKMNKNFDYNLDTFITKFCNGEIWPGRWNNHVENWLLNNHSIKNGFIFVKYEDLKENTLIEVKRIMKFLSIKKSDKDIQKAIQWASFENMRRLENEQQDRHSTFSKSNNKIPFVRKGNVNGWKNVLTTNQKNMIDQQFRRTLFSLGYEDTFDS